MGDMFPEPFTDSMLVYDLEDGSWDSVRIPIESLRKGTAGLFNVIDVTVCVSGDKLALLVTGDSQADRSKQVSVYATLDAEGNWQPVGWSDSFAGAFGMPTFAADDAGALYLFGGTSIDSKGAAHASNMVSRVSVLQDGRLAVEPVSELKIPRAAPRVSYGDGVYVVSAGVGGPGGSSWEGVGNLEIVNLSTGSTVVDMAPYIGATTAFTF